MPIYRTIVRLSFPFGSGGGTNTWHIRTVGEGDNAVGDLDAQMDSVRQWYDATAGVWCPNTVATWDGNYVAVDGGETLEGVGVNPWTELVGAPVAEGSAGNASMACVTWRSTLRSRRGRGRTFVGPLAGENVEANGTLSPGTITDLATANAALIDRNSAGDLQGAVVVWSEADQVARDIVRATVTDQVAVLRSRRN